MPLFWTFAEGLILIALRRGFLLLEGKKGNQVIFFLFSLGTFLMLVYMRFEGEGFFDRFVDIGRDFNIVIYKRASWNLFCTIWVILEGLIMIYVFRIYKILRANIKGKGSREEDTIPLKPSIAWGIPVLVVSFLSFYAFYQYNFIYISNGYRFNLETIRLISAFYIRICGLFWIIFEWIVAIVGIRTYLLLKDMG